MIIIRRIVLALVLTCFCTSAFAQFQSPSAPGAPLNSPAFTGTPTAPTQSIPDYSTAINAKDVASAAPPAPSSTIPAPQAAGFAAAAGVNK